MAWFGKGETMSLKRVLAAWVAFGLCGAMLSGCGTPPPAVGADSVSIEGYPRVTASGGLNGYMRVNRVNEYQKDGVLYADVDVRWTGQYAVFYEWRFIFFDARGRAMNPDGPWTEGGSSPGAVDYLRANATRPDAVNWRVEIRPRRG